MRVTVDLREVLAGLVVDLVVFAELGDEAEIHPDTAVKLLEGAVAEFGRLGTSDRLWLYDYVRGLVAQEAHPDRRRVLEWLAAELLEDDA
jgi:hypothetical protein